MKRPRKPIDDGPNQIELTPEQHAWFCSLPPGTITGTGQFWRMWERELMRRQMERKVRAA